MKSTSARLLLFLTLCIALSWYSWLLGYATDPDNSGMNPLGVLAAALVVSAAGGWGSFKTYVRRVTRVRSDWTTYATALFLPLFLAVLTVAVLPTIGAAYPAGAPREHWKDAVDGFLVMFLFVALGEEPGWRGWLLPFFRERLSPLWAALAVAPFWALWHLPMWGRQIPLVELAPFLISVVASCVVLAWLTNRTRGGVLPAMLCHASVNAFGSAWLFNFVADTDKTAMRWINAILWVAAAVAVAMVTKGRLGDSGEDEVAAPEEITPAAAI